MSNILKGITLTEAVDQSWIQAYKALEANGGEPNVNNPTLFIKQLAMLAKDAGIQSYYVDDFVKQYISDNLKALKTSGLVKQALKQAPSMTDMKKYTQQSQADDTSFAQQQTIGRLQHELSAQQLINQSNLEKADAEQLVQMDANARFAIQAMKQELALDAKERLHKLQMEIDATAERKDIRDHELKLAQAGYDHEVNVINVRAEGEYKKAKLEADYQIQIKQLENIDNAGERQNKLDQINADKARQIEIIDAETNAKVRVLQKEVDVERQQNDIAIEKAYMMTFNPIWGSAVSAAQLAGKTWKGAINNINKALSMLASPVMPKPVKEGGVLQARKTDSKGRTQQQWIEAVYKKFPNARIVQAKMIDGPAHAMLPDGRKFSWTPVEQGMAEAKKANTKTARKEFGKRPPAKLSDKEQEKKQADSDEAWERLMAYAAAQKEKEVKEGDSFGSFAGLKDWQVWNVHVYNNYYRGKYADYGPRLYSVVASSPDEARQIVIDNADYVLRDLLSRKLQSGKKVLPRGSALPVEEKRVGKAEPGSITTVGFKEMLTPDGPMKLKFSNGKIVASEEQEGVAEGINPQNYDSDEDYYDDLEADELDLSKFGRGWDIPDEIASLQVQLRHAKSQFERDQIERKIARYEQIYYGDDELDESEKEADYGDDYQNMVKRVGQKAKEQEKKNPVDIQALARKLNQPEKKSNILKGIEENLGTPYPSTYEEENDPFKKKGAYRITAMTSEGKK